MNPDRDRLIRRLVDRKMASTATRKIGCVPCFGQVAKARTSGAPVVPATK